MTLRNLGLSCGAILTLWAGSALPARAACKLESLVELPVTMVGMQPTVTVSVNGQEAQFLVDSGAFYSVISPAAAARFGLKPYSIAGQLSGVGGKTDVELAKVKAFNLAKAPIKDHEFLVAPGLSSSVAGAVGEDILGVADVEYDLANGVVRLIKPVDCAGENLGYWAKGAAAELPLQHTARPPPGAWDIGRHVQARAALNGRDILLIFDTGANTSILTQSAAARVGVTPSTPGAVAAGLTSGFGPRAIPVWMAPFDTFELGSEQIKNTRMRFGTIELGDGDMLLGADFFLSHRVYVANSQGKVFLTYNGGPVFRFDRPNVAALTSTGPETHAGAAASPTPDAAADNDSPTTADGFLRRAAASIARQDFSHALEDLDRAIALEPANANAYVRRSQVRLSLRQPVLAIADLDQAIKLKPEDQQALLARGALFAGSRDWGRAGADFEAAARLDPPDGRVRLAIAGLYQGAARYDDAIGQYDAWLATNAKTPHAPEALNGRCWSRTVQKKDLDKALADCDAALRLSPRSASFLDSRGLTHLDRGELDLAMADYDAALKLAPKVAVTLYARGVTQQKKGLKDAGDADIKAAIALEPKIADRARLYGLVADSTPSPATAVLPH